MNVFSCLYNKGVFCNHNDILNCEQCGWNPTIKHNRKLKTNQIQRLVVLSRQEILKHQKATHTRLKKKFIILSRMGPKPDCLFTKLLWCMEPGKNCDCCGWNQTPGNEAERRKRYIKKHRGNEGIISHIGLEDNTCVKL